MALGRVLVVEDEPDVRKTTRLVLEKAGYDVVEAEDGEQAIEVLHSGDNPLMVDLIISDLNMPKVSGMEAIPYFCSHFGGIPILVLTGSMAVTDVTDSFRQGIVDYLTKPITQEKLLAAVDKAVKTPRTFE